MDTYLNGELLNPAEASVRVEDAGFQHAVGLFETLGAYHGRAWRLEQHLERMRRSAADLGLATDLDLSPLREAVERAVAASGAERARVRLTVTPGPISLLNTSPAAGSGNGQPAPGPTVAVQVTEPTQYDPRYFDRGITVAIAGPLANPFDPMTGHKTLAYWGRLRTLRQAAAAGAGEALWLNITNHLASGAVSNLFLVKDGILLTPFARGEEVPEALPAPVLPGVTRGAVIELAEREKIPVTRRMLTVEDLLGADEVFLTNSSWLVLPVTRVEKKEIGSGNVGPITRDLRMKLATLVDEETGGPAAGND